MLIAELDGAWSSTVALQHNIFAKKDSLNKYEGSDENYLKSVQKSVILADMAITPQNGKGKGKFSINAAG